MSVRSAADWLRAAAEELTPAPPSAASKPAGEGAAECHVGQWQRDGGVAQMAAYQRFLHRRYDRWGDEDSRQRYLAMAELRRRTGQVSWQEEQAEQSRQRQERLSRPPQRLPVIAGPRPAGVFIAPRQS